MTTERTAIVWGNCQAEPLGRFLEKPLAAQGIRVVHVPPVYLIERAQLDEVRREVARCSLFVTQPVAANYRGMPAGMDEMVELLPGDATVVTIPVVYDSTEFPWQVVGHGADGDGVFAPLTSYHDLRVMRAAELGRSAEDTLAWLADAVPTDALLEASRRSIAEMRRREAVLDVTVSGVLARPGAMFTVNHPTNAVLCHVGDGVLQHLGFTDRTQVPAHEELQHTTTPLELSVLRAHGWPETMERGWIVGFESLDLPRIVAWHLEMYAARADVIADARARHGELWELLGLS